MKIQQIRAKAKALQLKSTFGLSKAELIRRIQKAEGILIVSERPRSFVIKSNAVFERIAWDLREPEGSRSTQCPMSARRTRLWRAGALRFANSS